MAGSRHSKAKNPYEIMIYLHDLKCEALDMQHKANARGDKEEEARCFGYGAGLERGEILLSEWLREQGERHKASQKAEYERIDRIARDEGALESW